MFETLSSTSQVLWLTARLMGAWPFLVHHLILGEFKSLSKPMMDFLMRFLLQLPSRFLFLRTLCLNMYQTPQRHGPWVAWDCRSGMLRQAHQRSSASTISMACFHGRLHASLQLQAVAAAWTGVHALLEASYCTLPIIAFLALFQGPFLSSPESRHPHRCLSFLQRLECRPQEILRMLCRMQLQAASHHHQASTTLQ